MRNILFLPMTKFKKEDVNNAVKTLFFLTIERVQINNFVDFMGEYQELSDEQWRVAKDIAVEEFQYEFDAFNDWIFEDDYESEAAWEEAIKNFIEEVLNKFNEIS